jgi:O-antigen/teichoic acid export membrane protein
MLSEQTQAWEGGDRDRVFAGIRRYALLATLGSAALLPPLLIFMPQLVRLLFDAKNLGAVTAARIVVVAGAVQFVVGWSKSFAVTTGRPQWRIWTHGIETAVLIPLAIVLGWRWGAAGAAVAVLVASVVYAIAWVVLFQRIRRDPSPLPHVAPPPEPIVAAGEVRL